MTSPINCYVGIRRAINSKVYPELVYSTKLVFTSTITYIAVKASQLFFLLLLLTLHLQNLFSKDQPEWSLKNGGYHGIPLDKILPWFPISFTVACKILHTLTSGISVTSCPLPFSPHSAPTILAPCWLYRHQVDPHRGSRWMLLWTAFPSISRSCSLTSFRSLKNIPPSVKCFLITPLNKPFPYPPALLCLIFLYSFYHHLTYTFTSLLSSLLDYHLRKDMDYCFIDTLLCF